MMSCFKFVNVTRKMSLPPSYIGRAAEGITEYLNSEILQFSKDIGGVILSYSKPSVRQQLGSILDEQPHVHFELRVTYCVFAPQIGSVLWGKINNLGEDHLGCLVYDCFNASVQEKGFLVGRNGFRQHQVGDMVRFRVTGFETSGGILSLKGEPINTDRHSQNTDTSLDSSGLDISSKKNKRKKKHKEYQTPVKFEQQQQHGNSSLTPSTDSYTESANTLSSHKKHKRKRRHDDSETSLLSVKHYKLDVSNAPTTPQTAHSSSDIVSSPFKAKHKKHKSKT